MDRKKKKKVQKIVRNICAALIIALTAGIFVILIANSTRGVRGDSPIRSVVTAEAGEEFDISSFLTARAKADGVTCALSKDSRYNINTPGDYALTLILSGGESHEVTLKVRDTIPPSYDKLPTLIVKRGAELKPEMLLPPEYVHDATPVKVTFLSSGASTGKVGHYIAPLILTDGGRNITKADGATYFVTENYNDGYCYEIGDEAPTAETLLPGATVERFTSENFTPDVPSPVTVYVTMNRREYFLRYEAKDTVPPVITLKDGPFIYYAGEDPPDPNVFIDHIDDQTEVSVSYDQDYIFNRAELKRLNILATDLGGNVASKSVQVWILEREGTGDKTPPQFAGLKDLVTEPGVKPDYLAGIGVYDNVDGVIPNTRVTVDDSRVDYKTTTTGAGYEVVYSVTDSKGNTATAVIHVRVVQNVIPEEELDVYFGQILGEIGGEEELKSLQRFTLMTRLYRLLTGKYALEKGKAHTDLSSIRREAYWGFRLGTGSDQTACAMLETLLDLLGVDHVRARRNAPGTDDHEWVMVDYDVGWLYVDTLPTYGYIWTTDGRLVREGSAEARALTDADVLSREAMTQKDIDALTAISNGVIVGWNYYKADLNELPPACERQENGAYTRLRYDVRYKPNNSGYGSISGITGQSVLHGGTTQTVRAVAGKGYRFVSWNDGVTEPERSDRVNRSITYTAIFEPDSETFKYFDVQYLAQEGGSISGAAIQRNILYGDETSAVTAIPDGEHYFVSWSDGSTEPTRKDVVRANAEYTAIFAEKIKLTYEAPEHGKVICGGVDSGYGGSVTVYVKPGERGVQVRAEAQPGYRFSRWSDGAEQNVRTDVSEQDLTVRAVFIKDTAQYTVQYTAGSHGAIRRSDGTLTARDTQTLYCWSVTKTVYAVPDDGYVFLGWSDGTSDPARSDTVLQNMTVQALFGRSGSCTVTYAAGDGGYIEGPAVQTLPEGEMTQTVRAVANEGYEFDCWTDGSTDPERRDEATVGAVYIAMFRLKAETPTETPVEPTETPVEPTEPPVEPTETPVEPTETPVEPAKTEADT